MMLCLSRFFSGTHMLCLYASKAKACVSANPHHRPASDARLKAAVAHGAEGGEAAEPFGVILFAVLSDSVCGAVYLVTARALTIELRGAARDTPRPLVGAGGGAEATELAEAVEAAAAWLG